MATYSEIKTVSMTPEKKAAAKLDLGAYYIGRPISYLVTIPFLYLGVSATAVSALSLLFAVFALIVFLIADTLTLFLLAWFLVLIWNILDGVDGNIARFTNTSSKLGALWDATVGWFATVVFYMGMGLAAWKLPGVLDLNFLQPYYFGIGCLTAMCWIFPRLVMHKKIGMCGSDSVSNIKARNGYGFGKIIFLNITSVNGIGALIFLLALVFSFTDLCLIIYFCISLLMAVFSCWSLLRN
jgi:phosphatidylglycerophosphate synthase